MTRWMLMILWGAMVFVLRCAPILEEGPSVSNAPEKQIVVLQGKEAAGIRYLLRWSWDGARWDATEKEYLFESEKGYRYGIQAGYVGTVAAQLVPSESSRRSPLHRWAWRWFPRLGIVHADHSLDNDVSMVSAPKAESLLEKEEVLLGQATLRDVNYSQAHLLMAIPGESAPDGYALQRWSFLLRGWYQKPLSEEKFTFQAAVSLPAGAMIPMVSMASDFSSKWMAATEKGQASLDLVFERSLVRALATIDPVGVTETELAYKTLLRLGQTTTATLLIR